MWLAVDPATYGEAENELQLATSSFLSSRDLEVKFNWVGDSNITPGLTSIASHMHYEQAMYGINLEMFPVTEGTAEVDFSTHLIPAALLDKDGHLV